MTGKLKFYLVLLVAISILLYLTPYFYPLLKDRMEPINEQFRGIETDIGLNPNAFIPATTLTIIFLMFLVLTLLSGRELKKQTLEFLHKILKGFMEEESETQVPQEKEH